VETGRTLAFLGLGLVAEAIINLLVRGFYALHDSKTPVVVGSVTVLINICLSLIFIFFIPAWERPVWGLALAVAIADTIYALVLIFLLNRRVNHFDPVTLLVPAIKIITAAALTGISLYIPMKLLDQLVFDTTRTVPLIMLTGIVSLIGLSVYLFITWILQIDELRSFLGLFGRITKIFSVAEEKVESTISEAVTEIESKP